MNNTPDIIEVKDANCPFCGAEMVAQLDNCGVICPKCQWSEAWDIKGKRSLSAAIQTCEAAGYAVARLDKCEFMGHPASFWVEVNARVEGMNYTKLFEEICALKGKLALVEQANRDCMNHFDDLKSQILTIAGKDDLQESLDYIDNQINGDVETTRITDTDWKKESKHWKARADILLKESEVLGRAAQDWKARAEKAEAEASTAQRHISDCHDEINKLRSALAAYQTGEPSEEQIDAVMAELDFEQIDDPHAEPEHGVENLRDIAADIARAVLACPPSGEYVAVKREDLEKACGRNCSAPGTDCSSCAIGLALKGGK